MPVIFKQINLNKVNQGLSPQTPATAQSAVLHATSFASIALWKIWDQLATTQVLPPG